MKNSSSRLLFRFLKWIGIILLVLSILIYFLNRGIKSKYCGFHRLNKDSIENVIIYKFDNLSINHHKDSLILSTHEINRLVWKWNNSYPIGPCKYIPSYVVIANMKNGNQRCFRTTGGTIKESNDFGYKFLMDENYFDKNWNKK